MAFEQVHFWNVASGKEMQGPPSDFAGVIHGNGTPNEHLGRQDWHKTETHLLSASHDMLLITELPSEEVPNPEQVACFKAPRCITSVLSHGATKWICVGCTGGEVCILQAPFLDPTLVPTPTLTDLESEDEESADEVDDDEQRRMEKRKTARRRRRRRREDEEEEDERESRADQQQQKRADGRTAAAVNEALEDSSSSEDD